MLLKNAVKGFPAMVAEYYSGFENDIPEDAPVEVRVRAYEIFRHVFISAYLTLAHASRTGLAFEWTNAIFSEESLSRRMDLWNRAAGRRIGEYFGMLWWETTKPKTLVGAGANSGVDSGTDSSSESGTDVDEEFITEMGRQIFNRIWERMWKAPVQEGKPKYAIPEDIHIMTSLYDYAIATASAQKITMCVPECSVDGESWSYSLCLISV